MRKTIAITVRGKVQGVWFRKYTQDKAIELQLTGSVRNTDEGDVAIVATGTSDQLTDFIEWCWMGSPKSKVTAVITSDVELQEFDRFEVVR
ncbi:acylphosphatase [Lacibacter cauensis]|uniref:acylphosphatase n=1 Tax=Lacibacter cauensis TaxID=510947 RepID=A0A562SEB2_9BACT|nr:acylphosphatase [Lacibacter cauensis]TWI79423.1 acylphosphatase [Lacibacter cauensis]